MMLIKIPTARIGSKTKRMGETTTTRDFLQLPLHLLLIVEILVIVDVSAFSFPTIPQTFRCAPYSASCFFSSAKTTATVLFSTYYGNDPREEDAAEFDDYDDDEDETLAWMSDREKAQRRNRQLKSQIDGFDKSNQGITTTTTAVEDFDDDDVPKQDRSRRSSAFYTEEEEDIIQAMGGFHKPTSQTTATATTAPSSSTASSASTGQQSTVRKRESGFLGDSTLQEIAQDYSVPICYLADVLCSWGVPVPIHIHDRLGDLVTGEQAFALVEAVYSLDVAAIQDRYSNMNLLQLCDAYDVPIQDAFAMAMKEGWNLPFGVQTCLRVEQEEELLRALSDVV